MAPKSFKSTTITVERDMPPLTRTSGLQLQQAEMTRGQCSHLWRPSHAVHTELLVKQIYENSPHMHKDLCSPFRLWSNSLTKQWKLEKKCISVVFIESGETQVFTASPCGSLMSKTVTHITSLPNKHRHHCHHLWIRMNKIHCQPPKGKVVSTPETNEDSPSIEGMNCHSF